MTPTASYTYSILPWILSDSPECNIYLWLVNATMTVDGIVRGVPSQILCEPGSVIMKTAMRPTLYRLQAILVRLQRRDRVTANHMAEELEVSARTIARDMDFLINSLHLPISYHFQKKSYVLNGTLPSLFAPPETLPVIVPSSLLGDE